MAFSSAADELASDREMVFTVVTQTGHPLSSGWNFLFAVTSHHKLLVEGTSATEALTAGVLIATASGKLPRNNIASTGD